MRSHKIDYIKGVLIFLVVLGHAIQYGSGHEYLVEESFFEDPIFKLIYTFHMPSFGIISGMLYKEYISSRTFGQKLKKILLSFMMPMALFSVLEVIRKIFEGGISPFIYDIVSYYICVFLYNWWFVWAIAIGYFIFALIECFRIKISGQVVGAVIIQLCFLLLPNSGNNFLYGFIFFYFCVGYFVVQCENGLKNTVMLLQKPGHRLVLFVSLIAWMVLYVFYEKEHYIYISFLSVSGGNWQQLVIDIYRWIIGLCGSITVLMILYKYIEVLPDLVLKILAFMGRNSLYIYILQGFFTMMLQAILTEETYKYHWLWNFLQTILIVITSCTLIKTYKQVKEQIREKEEWKRRIRRNGY